MIFSKCYAAQTEARNSVAGSGRLRLRTWSARLVVLALLSAMPAYPQGSFDMGLEERFTAQSKPQVTVFDFKDNNADAESAKYGEAVAAMMVTFLKTRSQFIVVERNRQTLEAVEAEWERNYQGTTNVSGSSARRDQLYQYVDAIIVGSVTVLGSTIEIDVKLLSRKDGRIIAATQRSGPIGCLRPIVDRMAVSLEQQYLNPYYGELIFSLKKPAHASLYLKTVVPEFAVDEEKLPPEHGSTIFPDLGADIQESWMTEPSLYRVQNLLGGWYSIRLSRPDYAFESMDNKLYVARKTPDEEAFEPWLRTGRKVGEGREGSFLVEVKPNQAVMLDADSDERTIEARKLGAPLCVRIQRPNQATQEIGNCEGLEEEAPAACTPTQASAKRVCLTLDGSESAGRLLADVAQAPVPRPSPRPESDVLKAERDRERARTRILLIERLKPQPQRQREAEARERALIAAGNLADKLADDLERIERNLGRLENPSDFGPEAGEEEDEMSSAEKARALRRAAIPGLAINRIGHWFRQPEHGACDWVLDPSIPTIDYGETVVRADETFDFDAFLGGGLAIESYRGEKLPEGKYWMFVWAPGYEMERVPVDIFDSETAQPIDVKLKQRQAELTLTAGHEHPGNHVYVRAVSSDYFQKVPLEGWAENKYVLAELPADQYTLWTDIEGQGRAWEWTVDLAGPLSDPPSIHEIYDNHSFGDGVLPANGIVRQTATLHTEPCEAKLVLEASEPYPGHKALIRGRNTGTYRERALDFSGSSNAVLEGLPFDVYDITLTAPGFESWRRAVDLESPPEAPVGSSTVGEKRPLTRTVLLDRAPEYRPPLSDFTPAPERETVVIERPVDRPVPVYQRMEPWVVNITTSPFSKAVGYHAPDLGAAVKEAFIELSRGVDKGPLRAQLLADLEKNLALVDLLILDDRIVSRLDDSPDLAGILRGYLSKGRALMLYTSTTDDVGSTLGKPLTVSPKTHGGKDLHLFPGTKVDSPFLPIKGRVDQKRNLPEFASPIEEGWEVVAFGKKKQRRPQVVERSDFRGSGYVLVWAEKDSALGDREASAKARRFLEERAFDKALALLRERNRMSRKAAPSEPESTATSEEVEL